MGWRPGIYTHVAGSLHIYEDTPPQIDYDNEEYNPDIIMPRIKGECEGLTPVEAMRLLQISAYTFLEFVFHQRVNDGCKWSDIDIKMNRYPEFFNKCLAYVKGEFNVQ